MSAQTKARCLAATGALIGGALVMLPIAIVDLLMLLPVQMAGCACDLWVKFASPCGS